MAYIYIYIHTVIHLRFALLGNSSTNSANFFGPGFVWMHRPFSIPCWMVWCGDHGSLSKHSGGWTTMWSTWCRHPSKLVGLVSLVGTKYYKFTTTISAQSFFWNIYLYVEVPGCWVDISTEIVWVKAFQRQKTNECHESRSQGRRKPMGHGMARRNWQLWTSRVNQSIQA